MAIRPLRYSYTDGGAGASPIQRRPEGASETYSKGAPLIDDGSGRLTVWTADADDIEGIAAKDGSNNSTEGAAEAAYYKVHDAVKFEASVTSASAFDTGATADSQVGQAYGLALSGGIAYVDTSDTTNTRVRVERLLDASGTVHGRAIVQFIQTGTDYDDT